MPHVLFEKRGSIAYVTLNRPEKGNAFLPEMIVRLVEVWADAANDPDVRVVLLTGAGDQAFSSGGDLGSTIPLMMRTRPPSASGRSASPPTVGSSTPRSCATRPSSNPLSRPSTVTPRRAGPR